MPTLGKGTECIKLLLSQASKDMHEPLVPMLFPSLGAHISGAEFQYPDNSWKEMCGLMGNLVAISGGNKGQLGNLVEAICRDFRQHDKAEAKRLLEWSKQKQSRGNNKDKPDRTFLKVPDTLDNTESLSAGDIMHELILHGFRGREYNSIAIGKTMKRLGFERKTLHGVSKYLVTKVDFDQHSRENKQETGEFVPEIF